MDLNETWNTPFTLVPICVYDDKAKDKTEMLNALHIYFKEFLELDKNRLDSVIESSNDLVYKLKLIKNDEVVDTLTLPNFTYFDDLIHKKDGVAKAYSSTLGKHKCKNIVLLYIKSNELETLLEKFHKWNMNITAPSLIADLEQILDYAFETKMALIHNSTKAYALWQICHDKDGNEEVGVNKWKCLKWWENPVPLEDIVPKLIGDPKKFMATND